MPWLYERAGADWWSETDEFDTKEEAISAGREWMKEEHPDDDYFDVGEKHEAPIPSVYADDIIDQAQQRMYDVVGEFSDQWLAYVTKEQQDILGARMTEVFRKWLEETANTPTFFTMVNVETVAVEVDAE